MTDVLADVVALLRPRAVFRKVVEGRGRWGIELPPSDVPNFAVVLVGSCWFQLADDPPLHLGLHDFVLLPKAGGYGYFSDPAASRVLADAAYKQAVGDVMRVGDRQGGLTTILGGHFTFDPANIDPLAGFLPELIHIRASENEAHRLVDLVHLIGQEALSSRQGREFILDRLAEVLLMEALRRPSELAGHEPKGLMGGLRDKQVRNAIRAMHADVRRGWTVAKLAETAGMSRATFARRFVERVGVPPLAYLSSWRMAMAKDQLLDGNPSVDEGARSVGYGAASAFSTAFARVGGCAPAR